MNEESKLLDISVWEDRGKALVTLEESMAALADSKLIADISSELSVTSDDLLEAVMALVGAFREAYDAKKAFEELE